MENALSGEYDAIVVGLGGMGSAALFHLVKRGYKVLGLEQFTLSNEMGSSHGLTRIIRLAYYEHPSYVPLVMRAYQLWQELEFEAGNRLLHVTGSIDAGSPTSTVFEGSRKSCELYGLLHEVLTSAQISARFPGYQLPPDYVANFQPGGGFLEPERCIQAYLSLAGGRGAVLHAEERVIDWSPSRGRVRVRTTRGSYETGRLIIAAGAWVSKLVPELAGVAVPERQVLAWLTPLEPELFLPSRFPVFNLAVEEGRYYGLPAFGIPGFKVGRYHHREEVVDPDTIDRNCYPEDEAVLRDFTRRYFPRANGETVQLKACMFTNTTDEHFLIDFHPEFPQVIVASPCSGHGFKFASVVGEIVADLVHTGASRHDISLFRLRKQAPKF